MHDMFSESDVKVHCFIKLLAFWYSHQLVSVKWQNAISGSFHVANGVKQGGILSPYLFRIYIREMAASITNLKVGCNIGGMMLNLLCYADDIVLLAPSWSALQRLINQLNNEAVKINMSFNIKKTVCMIVKPVDKKYQFIHDFPQFTVLNQTLSLLNTFFC